MTWLLDVNVNRKLIPVLRSAGIKTESAIDLGWRLLTNGHLIEAAFNRGFGVMLTNDIRILESSGKNLANYPKFGLVLLRLPQVPSEVYLRLFKDAWDKSPIVPSAGTVVSWPN